MLVAPGSLVTMCPGNAPPKLYGVGLVVEVGTIRARVVWRPSAKDSEGRLLPVRTGWCHPRYLKAIP